jgi:UDP-N-acetylglucosamine 2-epimerase (non-hydrolysing)/GDP/UDP-N,N'-diacetylbacillosamine 2-epimerase (hydrolysing)
MSQEIIEPEPPGVGSGAAAGPRRTIAVVTSSRADYGHLLWPLREIDAHPGLDLRLIVTGAHLSPEFGLTVHEIERDGIPIAERIECLLSSDTDVGMARTIGLATLSFADVLGRMRPDLLLLIADRYEMLAPASAALALRVPIAHIEGGEVSEGAIDHAVRNALTMMSHVHFTPTVTATRRVIAMGEEAWRVHRVGAPSLDHLRRTTLPDRDELERRHGLDLAEPPVVVAYHPVTLARDTTSEADAVFAALERLDGPIVFCFPNADAGSRRIIERAGRFCATRPGATLVVNLGPPAYWSLLRHARLLYGNSSSGIMESASLELPTVNIGRRQAGRERPANVVDAAPEADAIMRAVGRAVDGAFRDGLAGMVNPYGDGRAAERIASVLAEVDAGERLLVKEAGPLPEGIPGGVGV